MPYQFIFNMTNLDKSNLWKVPVYKVMQQKGSILSAVVWIDPKNMGREMN